MSETTLTLAQVEAAQVEAAQGRYSRSVQSPIYENYRDSARDVPDLIATVREQQARITTLESELGVAQREVTRWKNAWQDGEEMMRAARDLLAGLAEQSRTVREDLAIEPPRPGPAAEDGV